MLFRLYIIALLYAPLCGVVKAEENYLYTNDCNSIVCKKEPEIIYSLNQPTSLILLDEQSELPDKLALTIYVTALLMLDERNIEIIDWKPEIKSDNK
ncbi:TPA: hypothetical protein ACN33E_001558 [Vibrio parahaemolyticus]|uniref:hypothetical protein n=1 Tax=Vibrio TaxID=662 RepID=UPI0020A44ECA|nr:MULTISPECIES: hypothetical protein [Vibrio]MCX8902980.1 hypothetical protein [Vibrio parahaemolyticus]HCE2122637.1 hypothetical protein [Vibrio parahaemolyticus]